MGDIEKICSLCGDIGFADALLRCPRCTYRLQHTYCSRYYPEKIDMERWRCEWCIHGEEEEERKRRTAAAAMATATKRQKRDHHDGGGAHAVAVAAPDRDNKEWDSRPAADRWRRLAKAAKGGSGKRYKLLLDVICS